MNHKSDARYGAILVSIALIVIAVLPSPAYSAAPGGSNHPVYARTRTGPVFACGTGKPDHASMPPQNSSPAANSLCRLYSSTVSTARSLFSNGGVFQNIPWAPALVGAVLVSFLALAGWCAWKTRGYRPRRKYKIGRTI